MTVEVKGMFCLPVPGNRFMDIIEYKISEMNGWAGGVGSGR